jgi:hypothetical protein
MAEGLRAWGEKHQLPLTAPMRDLMAELFGREIAEQRIRIRSLAAAGGEPIPSSSTVPTLTRRLGPGEASLETHVSTISDFVDRLHRDQRKAFGWMYLVLGFLASAVIVLGVAFATRESERPPTAHAAPRVEPSPTQAAALSSAVPPAAPANPTPRPVVVPLGELPPVAVAAPIEHAATFARDTKRPRERVARSSASAPPAAPAAEPTAHPPAPPPGSAPARPPAEHGYLTLDTTPWSEVRIDGVSLGQTPIVRAKLPAGPHTVVLVNSERGLSTTYQVSIEPGKTSSRRLALD